MAPRTRKWSPDSPDTKRLLKLLRESYSLRDIAAEFDISAQRIEQILFTLKTDYGVDVDYRFEKLYWTVRDVKSIIGISSNSRFMEIASKAWLVEPDDVTYHNGKARFTFSGVKKIEQAMERAMERKCSVCGNSYIASRKNSATCSEECSEEAQSHRFLQTRYEHPHTGGLLGMINSAILALPETGEPWIKLSLACRSTNLTRMQIEWLIIRNVLPVRQHPTEMWGSKPLKTIRLSHVKIAEQFYKQAGKIC